MHSNQPNVERIQQVHWANAKKAIMFVREQVFILEQGIPAELEWEQRDTVCIHLLAYAPNGQAIGTARLLSCGLIGRMAVLSPWRHQGFGTQLLKKLIAIALLKNMQPVHLHAQTHALAFYRRFGFAEQGAEIDQAGIAHRLMHYCAK